MQKRGSQHLRVVREGFPEEVILEQSRRMSSIFQERKEINYSKYWYFADILLPFSHPSHHSAVILSIPWLNSFL